MDKFEGKTNTQLLEIHNDLAAQTGDNLLKSWKQAKTKLIERIEQLEDKVELLDETKAFDAQADGLEYDGDHPSDDGPHSGGVEYPAPTEPTDEEIKEAKRARQERMGYEELPEVDEIVDEVDAKTEKVVEANKPKLTIRERSLELLCQVDYYEDKTKKSSPENRVEKGHRNARSVGIPYSQVIETIHSEFPDAKTSVACLRWYAVKVRAEEFGYEGYRLCQRRPRFPGK